MNVELHPYSSDAQFALSEAYAALGEKAKAIASYMRTFEMDKAYSQALDKAYKLQKEISLSGKIRGWPSLAAPLRIAASAFAVLQKVGFRTPLEHSVLSFTNNVRGGIALRLAVVETFPSLTVSAVSSPF